MDHNNQQLAALNTDIPDYGAILKRITPNVLRLLHACMGIQTESGELMDVLKRYIFYGKEINRVNMFEEGGGC